MAFLSCVGVSIACWMRWLEYFEKQKKRINFKQINFNQRREARTGHRNESHSEGCKGKQKNEQAKEPGFISCPASCSCVSWHRGWCECLLGAEASQLPLSTHHLHQAWNHVWPSLMEGGYRLPSLLSLVARVWEHRNPLSAAEREIRGRCCSCGPVLDPGLPPPDPSGKDRSVPLAHLRQRDDQNNRWKSPLNLEKRDVNTYV